MKTPRSGNKIAASVVILLLLGLVAFLGAFVFPGHRILYPFGKDGYIGFINENKKLVVEPKYTSVGRFSEGLAFARVEPGLYECINTKGKVVFRIEADQFMRDYKEGLAAFKKDGKWGFIDRKGNIVIEPQYLYVPSFSEGLVGVGSFVFDSFYINKKNEDVFGERFYSCGAFSEGYAVVGKWPGGRDTGDAKDTRYGIINHNGEVVVPIKYRVVRDVSDGLYGIGVFPESMPPDGEIEEWMSWVFIDIETGEVQFEWPNVGIRYPYNGYLAAYFKEEDSYGIINTKGEIVVEPQFDRITEIPSEGLYVVYKEGVGEWYITPTGKEVFPVKFDVARPFYGKLARVVKDGKSGYIDRKGEIIYIEDILASK